MQFRGFLIARACVCAFVWVWCSSLLFVQVFTGPDQARTFGPGPHPSGPTSLFHTCFFCCGQGPGASSKSRLSGIGLWVARHVVSVVLPRLLADPPLTNSSPYIKFLILHMRRLEERQRDRERERDRERPKPQAKPEHRARPDQMEGLGSFRIQAPGASRNLR